MFEFIRTHRRFLQVILLLAILPSFAFFGVQGYSSFMGNDNNAIAKVGRQKISEQELEVAMRNRIDQLRQQYGPSLDPKMVDTPESRKLLLEQLLDQKVLAVETASSHIVASDQLLRSTLQNYPELQSNGKFDYDKYRSLLAAQGSNEQIFEAKMRTDLAQARIIESIASSSFLPKKVIDNFIISSEQPVEVQERFFKPEEFLAQIKPDDAALKKFYEETKKTFEIAEKLSAEYVVLNSDALSKNVSVSPEEIKAFYDQNQTRFGTQEQRRASHILINAPKDAKEADKLKAKQEAEQLLALVKKDPSAFAKIAKEKSQDPGSAAQEGDLGFFARGAMVKPFEDAAFAMKQGEISALVQSDFGFHIIMVTEIKPAAIKSLDEVKAEIQSELQKSKAAKMFAEAAEQFSNLVYEKGDSFAPVVEKFKLQVQKVEALTRAQAKVPVQPGQVIVPRVIEALFKEESIKSRKNTEAIEVPPNTLVAARVLDYQPARIPPFEDIRAQVQDRYVKAEASKRALQAGKEALAKLAKDTVNTSGFSAPKSISRSNPNGVPPVALPLVMQASIAGKFPTLVGTPLADGSYGLYRLISLGAKPVVDETKRAQFSPPLSRLITEQEAQGVVSDLRVKHKAVITKTSFASSDAPGLSPSKK